MNMLRHVSRFDYTLHNSLRYHLRMNIITACHPTFPAFTLYPPHCFYVDIPFEWLLKLCEDCY